MLTGYNVKWRVYCVLMVSHLNMDVVGTSRRFSFVSHLQVLLLSFVLQCQQPDKLAAEVVLLLLGSGLPLRPQEFGVSFRLPEHVADDEVHVPKRGMCVALFSVYKT